MKKAFLFFLSLRLIGLFFTLNIYSQFTRSLGDAQQLITDVSEEGFQAVSSIFSVSTIVNQTILTTILPSSLPYASLILSLITGIIIWKNLREFLIYKNSILLWITIFIPSFVVWTILPSKEANFISFSLIYVCFEAKNIVFKEIQNWNRIHILFQRIIFIIICIALRGFASIPYVFLGFFMSIFPIVSSFLMKFKNNKSNFFIFITLSSVITLLCISIISFSENAYFLNQGFYLQSSFLGGNANLSREFLFGRNPFELKNFILLPYLSLFPSIQEFLSNPKLIFYVIDSSIYLLIYIIAWNKIINKSLINPRKIKFLQYFFISVTITYMIIYSSIGAYNLGSSLRFRQNFINIGHIFPLVIFYNIQKKKRTLLPRPH